MYLCRRWLRCSYPEIGHAFGRDHTTAMAAIRGVEEAVAAPVLAGDRQPVGAVIDAVAARLDAADERRGCPVCARRLTVDPRRYDAACALLFDAGLVRGFCRLVEMVR
jgi:hypothetical protein